MVTVLENSAEYKNVHQSHLQMVSVGNDTKIQACGMGFFFHAEHYLKYKQKECISSILGKL